MTIEQHAAAKHGALAEAVRYAGPLLSTIGDRPEQPQRHVPLGRPMKNGSFEKPRLAPLPPAPRPGHWSEAQAW